MWNQLIKKSPSPRDEMRGHIQYLIEANLLKAQRTPSESEKIREAIRKITYFAILGDNNDVTLFDQFMEGDIMLRFYDLLQQANTEPSLVQEIFEAVSRLLLNIKEASNKHYILSHSCINNMILWKTPFERTKPPLEIVEIYIGFLNLLACKIDAVTLMFFINIKYPWFPLMWNAIRFYNHNELFVRNKSRSIVLNLIKMQSEQLRPYITSFPFIMYYFNLGEHFIVCMKSLNSIYTSIMWSSDKNKWQQFLDVQEEIIEQLQYISDLVQSESQLLPFVTLYTLLRPVQFIAQVILFGYDHLQIDVAYQMLALLVRHFTPLEDINVYLINAFLRATHQKVTNDTQQWGYLNCLDNDSQFLFRLCQQIYQTGKPIELAELKHENTCIRILLQELRAFESIQVQKVDYDSLIKRLRVHENKSFIRFFILQILEQYIARVNQSEIQAYLYTVFLDQFQPLILQLKVLDIFFACSEKQTQGLRQHLFNQIKSCLEFVTYTDLQQVLSSERKYFSGEISLNEIAKIQTDQANWYFKQYPQLVNSQKLQFNYVLNNHLLFSGERILKQASDLKIDSHQIGQRLHDGDRLTRCFFSQTGHFYNHEDQQIAHLNSFIVENSKFLHIVSLDKDKVISDVVHSSVWAMLDIEMIAVVNTMSVASCNDTKFFIKFVEEAHSQHIIQLWQQGRQDYFSWYKSIIN